MCHPRGLTTDARCPLLGCFCRLGCLACGAASRDGPGTILRSVSIHRLQPPPAPCPPHTPAVLQPLLPSYFPAQMLICAPSKAPQLHTHATKGTDVRCFLPHSPCCCSPPEQPLLTSRRKRCMDDDAMLRWRRPTQSQIAARPIGSQIARARPLLRVLQPMHRSIDSMDQLIVTHNPNP